MNTPTTPLCTGCAQPLGQMEALRYSVCLGCTVARHKAVVARRCVCPRAQKRPTEVKRMGSRSWISCHRCLGQIKQLS